MTTLRIIKNNPTMTLFDRTFLQDKRLGLAERGLLAWLLQQENGTCLSIKKLKQQLPDTNSHIDASLLSLKISGYVLSVPTSQDNKITDTTYYVYERPQYRTPTTPASKQHFTLITQQTPHKTASTDAPLQASVWALHTIGNTLSTAQKILLKQAATHTISTAITNTYCLSDWQHALEGAMLDNSVLPTLHPDFFKKLKGLKACAQEGVWFPTPKNTAALPDNHSSAPALQSPTESSACPATK